MNEREVILKAVGEALAGDGRIRIAIAFGSVARGSYTAASDLDLAVGATDAADLLELSHRLSSRIGREVDIVPLAAVTVPLRERILRDGIVVHEGHRGAAAEWWSRALSDRETDGPWFRRMRDAWLARVANEGIGNGRR